MPQKLSVRSSLHPFPQGAFGSTHDLIDPIKACDRDTLLIACSELGAAPDNVSILAPERLVVLQHIGASIPSKFECEEYEELSFADVANLFDEYSFRHVIICGHLNCQVIPYWLQPKIETDTDIGHFRRRFENGTRDLVDRSYSQGSAAQRHVLMICEHVLCQIENFLTHPFVMKRAHAKELFFHGWVIDDETARVFRYNFEESVFEAI